jgi:hypothetical protein
MHRDAVAEVGAAMRHVDRTTIEMKGGEREKAVV